MQLTPRPQSNTPASRMLRRLVLVPVVLFLGACGAPREYAARLSPPSPEKHISAVDFAIAFTGGKESFDSVTRTGDGHMCGMPVGSRKKLFSEGVSAICSRRGGLWTKQVCEQDMDVLFVALVSDNQRRVCNASLEDFFVSVNEPKSGVSQKQFNEQMAAQNFKSTHRRELEYRTREKMMEQAQARAVESRAQQMREEAQRQALAREQLLARAKDLRSKIKTGTFTNCGPVIELRGNLAKVYFPVHGYGNEHWLEIDSLYPSSAGCSFTNGRYDPPL